MNLVQHIIFDLDGTLWNTAESYLYAYEKLCKLFPHSFTRTKEEIWKLLGIPLEDVVHSLQEFQVPKEQLAYDALTFSIEYIRQHPQYYINHLYSFFEALSKDYKISILSNCPKAYMQTFLELTKVQNFLYQIRTIEDGSKEQHLETITKN